MERKTNKNIKSIIDIVLIILGFALLPIFSFIFIKSSWGDIFIRFYTFTVSIPLITIGAILILINKNFLVDIIVISFGLSILFIGMILRIASGYPERGIEGYLMDYWGEIFFIISFSPIIIGIIFLIVHIATKKRRILK